MLDMHAAKIQVLVICSILNATEPGAQAVSIRETAWTMSGLFVKRLCFFFTLGHSTSSNMLIVMTRRGK